MNEDELPDNGITIEPDAPAEEPKEPAAELAPAPESEPDKTQEESNKLSEGAQKAINKQHFKYKEEERKRLAIEDEKQKLADELAALKAKTGEVVIPELPDPYDDNYEERLQAREAALLQKAKVDAQREFEQSQATAKQNEAEQARQAEAQVVIKDYESQAVKLGVDLSELAQAEAVVNSYGVDQELAMVVMKDDQGPLIVKHLAANPLILDELSRMSPIEAALKIHTQIKPAASQMKPQASSAPDPVETLDGRSAGEEISPYLSGVTIE